MSKIIEVRRFSFEELSEEAQAKALEKERQDLAEWCPNDIIEEQMLDKLGAILYGTGEDHKLADDIELGSWDVNYSQGSDVIFKGTLNNEVDQLITWPEGVVSLTLKESGNSWQTLTLFNAEDEELDDNEEFTKMWRSIRSAVLKAGQDAHEDFSSEESAKEQINLRGDAGDEFKFVFLEDGTYNTPKGVVV